MNSKVIREDECLSATTIPTIFESRGRCRHSPDLVTHRIQRLLSYCVVFVDLLKLRGCWWSCCLIFLLCRTIPLSSKFAINGRTWARYVVELFSEKNRGKGVGLDVVVCCYFWFIWDIWCSPLKAKLDQKERKEGLEFIVTEVWIFQQCQKLMGFYFFLNEGEKRRGVVWTW